MLRLSIIIPVYNVEQYIRKCLMSCLNQNLDQSQYEIIVVDDGSIDGSANIVKEVAQNISNILLVRQKNSGLSVARNTGLAKAKGEYVWFVDSDDWIQTDSLEYLVNTACDNELDVLCFGVRYYHTSDHIDFSVSPTSQVGIIMSGKDFITKVDMIPAAWVAIYNREFLLRNNLRFLEGILHEDQEFTPRVYCMAQKIMYIHQHEYVYLQRQGSIMKSKHNSKRCQDLLKVADSLYAFAIQNLEEGTAAYNTMMRKVYFCLSQSLSFYTKEAMPLTEYKAKPYFPINLALLSGNMKRKAMLINFSVRLYYKLYKLYKAVL